VATRERRALEIFVPDDGLGSRPARLSVSDGIEDFDLSPKAERALVTAHGDVFSVPREHGDARNLTRTPGAHERGAAWSPDGRQVAFLSDRTGEEELYVTAQDGTGQARPLTRGGKVRRNGPSWSPTGRHLSFDDKDGRLWIVSVDDGELIEVARDRGGNLRDAAWSPHGSHLAFSMAEESGLRALWTYSVEERALRRVSDGTFDVRSPAWDPGGEYLYVLSDRTWAPQLSGAEWNFATSRSTGVFALALRADVEHPFPPKSDEVTFDEEEADEQDEDDEQDGDDADDAPKRLEIDFEGLAERVTRVPIEADNYSGLSANDKALFVVRSGDPYYGRESERKSDLVAFDLEERETKTLAEDVQGYALAHDGTKLLVRSGGGLALFDAAPGGAGSQKSLDLSGLWVERVPREEWLQIFDEVWRRYRDYFYVANMHGYDWAALRERYRPLVEHVGHRSDLNYVLGEMIAELNVSHAYVAGGLWQAPERPAAALLGAQFELHEQSGLYRIVRILPGHNEEPKYRSPLTEVGVDVSAGEFLLAVDGVPLRAPDNPYRLLAHKAGRTLKLSIASSADAQNSRVVEVRGIPDEHDLLYLDMVLSRRALVAELSGGRLGYLHVPNMGADGIAEFIKWYYGQIRRQGLVVDVRNNGGGNVSQMLIERLSRRLLGNSFARNSEFTSSYPDAVFTGPMVCLLNENSASDGDIFPWMFRTAGLGPLIGKRSWGGVVGISDHGPLIDGGSVSVPEFGYADAAGQWSVEGAGVVPDIEVENDPASVLAGRDPQLERGVRELLERLAEAPGGLPARPADPVRTQ
jgi:tricorn protease